MLGRILKSSFSLVLLSLTCCSDRVNNMNQSDDNQPTTEETELRKRISGDPIELAKKDCISGDYALFEVASATLLAPPLDSSDKTMKRKRLEGTTDTISGMIGEEIQR